MPDWGRDARRQAINAQDHIKAQGLAPHPEGGWYRETWRGPENTDGRAVGTAILFLLESNQRSHWHRVDAHELWLWQAGDPLALLMSETDDGPQSRLLLGPDSRLGQRWQGVVPAGHWQAAEPIGGPAGFTLVSCVVTPGFDFSGFELAPPGWQPG